MGIHCTSFLTSGCLNFSVYKKLRKNRTKKNWELVYIRKRNSLQEKQGSPTKGEISRRERLSKMKVE